MSSSAPPVVAIYGPTGSGKTEVAVRVAAALGTEVVNCDPAQCYRGLPILTNQPGPEHDAIAPHRMVGVWGMDHVASFVGFADQSHQEIDDLVATTGHAVACGGSGLYLQAAVTELPAADHGPAALSDPVLRAELERRWEAGEGDALHAELAALDPRVGTRTHPNDRPRVVRALEVARLGGSISPDGASHWDAPHRHGTVLVHLQVERPVIRERITGRTSRMFDAGVLDEVAALAGADGARAGEVFSSTARKLHGLEDCLGVLRGEWTREHAIELMATRTRQYAKRQDTWARRWPGIELVDATDGDVDRIAQAVLGLTT
ncbi:MAG: tRNA ((37)-N6)-dimethylallyltransferase MiaA [Thermoleophilia bacterium]|nr:tRNA ((37)-N6)-dimethylallyltransferase MiaA [Thermoleophilia bacterium]